jgi:hypothetical protein
VEQEKVSPGSVVTPTCLSCGSTVVPCPICVRGADFDSQIATWIEEARLAVEAPASSLESACTHCGYTGTLTRDGRGAHCPACGVVVPVRGANATLRIIRTVSCPECGRCIGVTAEYEGKTVICPGCSYFLGTPLGKPGAGRRRGL